MVEAKLRTARNDGELMYNKFTAMGYEVSPPEQARTYKGFKDVVRRFIDRVSSFILLSSCQNVSVMLDPGPGVQGAVVLCWLWHWEGQHQLLGGDREWLFSSH